MTTSCFPSEDLITQSLRALYESAGYRAYKIRKFEEYSLYLENRNFLSDDHIITFNDQNGRLLALKPDITLSIVKNKKGSADITEKLYYRESVYRFDKHAHEYQEISQMGLELVGQVTQTAELEVLQLALDSLAQVSQNTVLAVSHMGYLNAVLEGLGLGVTAKAAALSAIASKNPHDLTRILESSNVKEEERNALKELIATPIGKTQRDIVASLCHNEDAKRACDELYTIYDMLCELGYGERVRLDFSVISEIEYYNGIVFKGYAEGLSRAVLSGGRYDKLAQKFSPKTEAIGFALYLGELLYHQPKRNYDTDILIIQSKSANPITVLKKAQELRKSGKQVRIESQISPQLRYRELIEM